MRASLRRLHSPDLHDLQDLSDADNGRELLVQAFIGPEGGAGEESFGFLLTYEGDVAETSWRWSVGRLALSRMRYALLEAAVRDICNQIAADTWHDVARALARTLHWEFAGYVPYSGESASEEFS